MEALQAVSHHVPVLLDEVIKVFRENVSAPSARFLDGTLGGGGHSEAILSSFPEANLVALDQDAGALHRAQGKLIRFGGRVTLKHLNFRDAAENLRPAIFDGLLLDLGISSDQLDDPLRGFSFKAKEVLDMRMNQQQGISALDLLNTASERELRRVLLDGGVRNLVPKLVTAIIQKRPIESAEQFLSICLSVLDTPRERRLRGERSDKNPATVVFQALRIAVNDELGAIKEFLSTVQQIAAPGAVLAVITFHSLEDELVTRQFRQWSRAGAPTRYQPEGERIGLHLTQKPIEPTEIEIERNPRCRSARLRAFKFSGKALQKNFDKHQQEIM